jgi:Ser/Thr protein kinase RdoA (MazF antagonist)
MPDRPAQIARIDSGSPPMRIVRSIASPEALLAQVLIHYEIGEPIDCSFLNPGLNDTFEVSTKANRFILRIYRAGWRTIADILYEFDILRHLDRRGVAVSVPVARRDGAYLQEVQAPEGIRFAALFTYAPGKPQDLNEETARVYGASAAVIHNESTDFRSPNPRFDLDLEHLITAPVHNILPLLADRTDDQADLQRMADALRDGVGRLPLDQLEAGFCHGDFHGGNAHMNDKAITFFDFDCCGPGWRAYDLAVFRWAARHKAVEEVQWPAFLSGYRGHREVTDLDMAAIPWFVAIRQLWWHGLHAGLAQDYGRGWMNAKYWDNGMTFLRGCDVLAGMYSQGKSG